MVGTKIEKLTYTGAGNVHSQDAKGLSSVVRKLAQDLARTRVNLFGDFTDSSGGTSVYPAVVAAQTGSGVAAFTETGTASAPKAGFDTAIGKVGDAMAVMAEHMNRINAALGIDIIVDSTAGDVATQGTIPALDLTLSAVNSSILDVVTGRARLETIKVNMARLANFANRIAVAVGEEKLTVSLGDKGDGSSTLDAITNSGSSVDGTALSGVADAVIDVELTAIGANIATIAAFMNRITGTQLSDLTGSLAGTPDDTDLEVQTVPDPAQGAATTSSPKAAFDTELVLIEKNLADLANRANLLLQRNNLTGSILTNSTGVSPDAALEDIDPTLAAVDGSTGTVAMDSTTGILRMTSVNDSMSSIATRINILCGVYGLQELTDAIGGTSGDTIANLAATDTGTGHDSEPLQQLLDTEVDAWLAALLNNLESMQVKFNDMTTADASTDIPLQVVAWDA